jgi:hypothetical protein
VGVKSKEMSGRGKRGGKSRGREKCGNLREGRMCKNGGAEAAQGRTSRVSSAAAATNTAPVEREKVRETVQNSDANSPV